MKGLSGGEALNKTFQYGGEAGKYSAQVTEALTGTQEHDLAKLVSGSARTFNAFSADQAALQGLIDNFNVFTGALANQSENLQTTIHELAPTLQTAHTSLVSLDRSLPPLRTYAIELTPAVAELPGLINASKPWLAQVRPLLTGKEAGGAVKLLAESTPGLAGATQAGKIVALPQANQLSQCTTKVLVPTSEEPINDRFGDGGPNYRDFWRLLSDFASASQNFDGNGPYVRAQGGGGPYMLEEFNPTFENVPPCNTSSRARSNRRWASSRSCRASPKRSRKSAVKPTRCRTSTAGPAAGRRDRREGGERPADGRADAETHPDPERRSRIGHFRAWLSRQARGHRTDTIAIIVLALVGIVMMLGIFTEQKASLPSWLPFVGEEFESISAEFTTAQAVTPGQGQAVDVAGLQIGKVSSVDLEDGHAVVGMSIEPKYMKLIHPDAHFLLRPKTGLNDMTVEVEPGTGKEEVEGRPPVPARADRSEHPAGSALEQPRRRHPPVHPAAGRRRGAGDRRPRRPARQRAAPLRAVRRVHRETEQSDRRPPHRAGEGDPRLRRTDHRTRQARLPDPPLRRLLRKSARQLRQPAGGARRSLRRVPGNPEGREGRPGELERILDRRAADADQADPAGAGLDAGLQGDREAVQPDDGADPRRHPALHRAKSARC